MVGRGENRPHYWTPGRLSCFAGPRFPSERRQGTMGNIGSVFRMGNESAQARHARKPAPQAPPSSATASEPADLIVRSVLPEDLLAALESERSLYRWVMLKGASDVRLEDE